MARILKRNHYYNAIIFDKCGGHKKCVVQILHGWPRAAFADMRLRCRCRVPKNISLSREMNVELEYIGKEVPKLKGELLL